MLNKPLHSKPQRQRLPSGGASDLTGHRPELYAGPFGNEYNGKRIRGNTRDRRHLPHHLDLETGPGVGTAPGSVFGIVRRTLSIHAEEERWMERPGKKSSSQFRVRRAVRPSSLHLVFRHLLMLFSHL